MSLLDKDFDKLNDQEKIQYLLEIIDEMQEVITLLIKELVKALQDNAELNLAARHTLNSFDRIIRKQYERLEKLKKKNRKWSWLPFFTFFED